VLLDTGADITTFNAKIAEFLKIDWRQCPSFPYSGIGGATPGYIHQVTIEYSGFRYDTEVAFVENLPRLGLLGMHGFFDRCKCYFDKEKGIVEISFKEEKGYVVL